MYLNIVVFFLADLLKFGCFPPKNIGNSTRDSLNNYRKLVKQLLSEYAEIPVFDSGIQNEVIFDLENDRYMLINIGWFNEQRIHHCVIHIDIIDGQVWI